MVGQTISHYKILAKLGEGGMGVVYQAEDTKLERTVALKFLPGHFLGNEEVRKRFEREAKAAAALQHPNICPVFEIDEFEGRSFIAMALIEGQSLYKKIAQGPLKLDEALTIAQQIAKGLEAAHKKGIVHRDVKPENVMLGDDNHVTIMDFGLAQLTEASRLTRADETMGTVAYMSPEQTQGTGTDHRTDIWSVGVVLYEMITGQKPFKGDYDKAVMYSILNEPPEPLTALRTGVPIELEVFVGKCLTKDVEKRYGNIGELARDLAGLLDKLKSAHSVVLPARSQAAISSGAPPPQALSAPASSPRKTRLPWALFAVAATLALYLGLANFLEPPAHRRVRRFSFDVESLSVSSYRRVAASPSGDHIAYIARGSLWVRDLDREAPRLLVEYARAGFCWSPDSRSIAYATAFELMRLDLASGASTRVSPLPGASFTGSAWSPDGETIVFSSGNPTPWVYGVSAQGGEPKALMEPISNEMGNGNVPFDFLPRDASARALIFGVGSPNQRELYLLNLDTGDSQALIRGAHAIYSPSGHILYQRSVIEAGLWALPFSTETLRATGSAFQIIDFCGDFSLTNDGSLVCADITAQSRVSQLIWRNRQGEKVGEIGQPQQLITLPALSPDETQVAAVTIPQGGGVGEIWLHETARPISQPLTFASALVASPAWSPDGSEVIFSSGQARRQLVSRRADGSARETILVESSEAIGQPRWSADGSHLIFTRMSPGGGLDLLLFTPGTGSAKDETQEFLAATPFTVQSPQFSPNGEYVAYCSNESGRFEVYVRDFPSAKNRRRVSENGGNQPRWSRDGAELFYSEGNTLVGVETGDGDGFAVGKLKRLFETSNLSGDNYWSYDVSSNGRFVMIDYLRTGNNEAVSRSAIHVVLNWNEEFLNRGSTKP